MQIVQHSTFKMRFSRSEHHLQSGICLTRPQIQFCVRVEIQVPQTWRQGDGVVQSEDVLQHVQQVFDKVNQLRQQGFILFECPQARHRILQLHGCCSASNAGGAGEQGLIDFPWKNNI